MNPNSKKFFKEVTCPSCWESYCDCFCGIDFKDDKKERDHVEWNQKSKKIWLNKLAEQYAHTGDLRLKKIYDRECYE